MKVENVTMAVGFITSIVTFEIYEAPLWIEIIGVTAATFVGWQMGCLLNIIWDYRHVTDPDPERSDVDITMAAFRKYSDLTADERAFIAEHEALHNRQRRKPYIEDNIMDDDIKNT